jgi:hypothetical protein
MLEASERPRYAARPCLSASSSDVRPRRTRVSAEVGVELRLPGDGRGAVDEEDELLVTLVPELEGRARLHDDESAPLDHMALGRVTEVDGQRPVEHDEDLFLRAVGVALAARARRIAPDVGPRLAQRVR